MFKRMLRPMLSFQSEINGSDFAGAAVEIAPRGEFADEREIATPLPDLLTRLSNWPCETREQRQRRDEVRSVLCVATQEAEAFINAAIQSRNEIIEAQLEEVRKKGRAQQKMVNRLESERLRKEAAFHSANQDWKWLQDELADLRATRLSRWASKEDKQERDKKIKSAEEALKQSVIELKEAAEGQNEAAAALGEAVKVMAQISEQESRLRSQLEGRVYFDPETMLPIPPQ